ncbi:velvet factor-domain-containing protein [Cercophora scortea]|uniref:Velvet factor-domain-containing protein n=1 Tax=Cercophora scortea TaxID=314031 RepID=A0AAE0J538_9PEZI|nr:velvet factor-domain-containing protein [Cercophora scortea]
MMQPPYTGPPGPPSQPQSLSQSHGQSHGQGHNQSQSQSHNHSHSQSQSQTQTQTQTQAQTQSQEVERVPVTLTPEQRRQQEENLRPYSSTNQDGRTFCLEVVQQPQRARMCGFGDKDRRPITPPPCVKLVIKGPDGREIDHNEIDHSLYVLNVDLWSDDGLREVNLVRHTTATPSISSTTPASYAAIEQSTPAFSHILPSNRDVAYSHQMPYQGGGGSAVTHYMQQQGPYSSGGYGAPNGGGGGGGYGPPTQYFPGEMRSEMGYPLPPGPPGVYGAPPPSHGYGSQVTRSYDPSFAMTQRLSISGNQPQGMFTRNLIGSLAASAFRLTNPDDKIGIWFIMQDLSVRTEGSFRLRFSFIDVSGNKTDGQPQNTSSVVTHGKARVMAYAFSDVFTVFSAKKFPGVCESTPLSKCFATQGIKIPIRKDGANGKGDGDVYDED